MNMLRIRLSITRFDAIVLSISLLLILAIGITVLAIPRHVLRVAYLRLDDKGLYQIFVIDPQNPASRRQLTNAPKGIYDFDTSPDGRFIVYTERDPKAFNADLYLLDTSTERITRLTNCLGEGSDCFAPVFNPNGTSIAYERLSLNNELGMGIGNSRIWLVDLTQSPPTTYPLISESQILGTGAVWSGDGQRIAFYDNAGGGIVVYTPADGALNFVPSAFGITGALSYDGSQMIYPEMTFDGQRSRAYLQIADLSRGVSQILTDPSEMSDDQIAVWQPNSTKIAIGRRYMDERYTRGGQIYLLDSRTMSVTPLVIDPRYSSGFFVWDASGERLVMQRFQQLDDAGLPYGAGTTEVWMYDMPTNTLIKLDDNARNPRWLP